MESLKAVEVNVAEVLRRCLMPIEQAVYECPSLWFNWPITKDLATMNLVTLTREPEKPRVPEADVAAVRAVALGGSAN